MAIFDKYILIFKSLFLKASSVSQILLLLVFRLNWGWQFLSSGKGKLLDHQKFSTYFSSLYLPLPELIAWFVSGVEFFGGLLLLLGLFTRPTGAVLTINMVVAYLAVDEDRQKVFRIFQEQGPFLKAEPFFYLLTALMAFSFGGGPFSLDALLNKTFAKDKQVSAKNVEGE